MFDESDEFLPPKEEEIPRRLSQKWEERESREGIGSCKKCRKQILASSAFCAYCGAVTDPLPRPWISIGLWLIAILVGIFVFKIWIHSNL